MADEKRSLTEYVERTWGQVEKGVEDAIQRSLSRVKAPSREDLQAFSTRLEALERRIQELEGRG
jgi:polyhydroxyalkanoate synthesis regulator phasin